MGEAGNFGPDVYRQDRRAGPVVVAGWLPNGPPAIPREA